MLSARISAATQAGSIAFLAASRRMLSSWCRGNATHRAVVRPAACRARTPHGRTSRCRWQLPLPAGAGCRRSGWRHRSTRPRPNRGDRSEITRLRGPGPGRAQRRPLPARCRWAPRGKAGKVAAGGLRPGSRGRSAIARRRDTAAGPPPQRRSFGQAGFEVLPARVAALARRHLANRGQRRRPVAARHRLTCTPFVQAFVVGRVRYGIEPMRRIRQIRGDGPQCDLIQHLPTLRLAEAERTGKLR